ncbi:MAG: class I SAM-dependent methyltransferase [Calditrichaeota bacterium]|nr:class I SAM-dependent methyltransferase [Calditrichota bacterium]
MPYDFHQKRDVYFQHQNKVTEKYIIPFIERRMKITPGMRVLEIGCAEAGVLKAFTDRGCKATGVDLAADKLKIAREMMKDELKTAQIEFFRNNIYEERFKEQFRNQFDLVILKDVIEHIPEQQNLLSYLRTFLKPGGAIFFAFPPWLMPFGGHQQMCNSFLKMTPYFHLLPMPVYTLILKSAGEPPSKVRSLIENKRTGITIERFERILKNTGYKILEKEFYLFNPIYEYKFGLKPRRQFPWLARIPYLRDFFTTAVYYLAR